MWRRARCSAQILSVYWPFVRPMSSFHCIIHFTAFGPHETSKSAHWNNLFSSTRIRVKLTNVPFSTSPDLWGRGISFYIKQIKHVQIRSVCKCKLRRLRVIMIEYVVSILARQLSRLDCSYWGVYFHQAGSFWEFLSGCPPKSGPASLGSPVNLPFVFCGWKGLNEEWLKSN